MKPTENTLDTEVFNKDVDDLWSRYADHAKLAPTVLGPLNKNAVLFVGMNPSFSRRGFEMVFKKSNRETKYQHILKDLHGFYLHEEITDAKKKIMIEIEGLSKEFHPYFNPMKDIAKELDQAVEHIDLIYLRDTNQKALEDLFDNKAEAIRDFLNKQIEISMKLIADLEPRMIIVCNAFASKKMKVKWDKRLEFDGVLGTYSLQLKGQNVPVFLSGMLTGQRAMDTESWLRMKWHIKKVLTTTFSI